MTDEQVEKLILKEIRKKDITYYDMKGLPNCGVDTNPEDKTTPLSDKGTRSNRFQSFFGSGRMKELLSVGQYNPYSDSIPLKISFQDLFRFWWNRCVEQELVVDEVLEDIFDYLTSLMAPPANQEEKMDMAPDFDRMPLLTPTERAAA